MSIEIFSYLLVVDIIRIWISYQNVLQHSRDICKLVVIDVWLVVLYFSSTKLQFLSESGTEMMRLACQRDYAICSIIIFNMKLLLSKDCLVLLLSAHVDVRLCPA